MEDGRKEDRKEGREGGRMKGRIKLGLEKEGTTVLGDKRVNIQPFRLDLKNSTHAI